MAICGRLTAIDIADVVQRSVDSLLSLMDATRHLIDARISKTHASGTNASPESLLTDASDVRILARTPGRHTSGAGEVDAEFLTGSVGE